MLSDIAPLTIKCKSVLPLTFSDCMSLYEQLCRIEYKMNEVIETVNGFGDDFTEYVDQQVDALRNELNGKFDLLQNKVDAQLADNEAKMQALEMFVNNAIEEQQSWVLKKINDLTISINNQLQYLRQYVDAQDDKLKSYIDAEIQKVIDMIPEIQKVMVVNPITGKLETLQDVLNYMTWVFKYYALTAQEYDNLHLAASEYDDLGLSAFDYDVYGKKLLKLDDRFYMRSPITGQVVFYKDVINWLITQHQPNALTAAEYDALELTASVYDGKLITAFDYDFNGVAA